MTPEQYLEIECAAVHRSEYFHGQMLAMAGASREHILICTNLISILRPQLRGRGCEIYANDMRVRAASAGLYTYPDIVIACGEPQFLDSKKDTLLNPIFIAEVLSPSTEAYDRGRKFESLDSLREYFLIVQDRLSADLYTRDDNRVWRLQGASRLEEIVGAQSIGCRIAMSDLYEDVVLPPVQETGELNPLVIGFIVLVAEFEFARHSSIKEGVRSHNVGQTTELNSACASDADI